MELTIDDAKLQRVHEVGHPERLCGGGGSSVLAETLVELNNLAFLYQKSVNI